MGGFANRRGNSWKTNKNISERLSLRFMQIKKNPEIMTFRVIHKATERELRQGVRKVKRRSGIEAGRLRVVSFVPKRLQFVLRTDACLWVGDRTELQL